MNDRIYLYDFRLAVLGKLPPRPPRTGPTPPYEQEGTKYK